MGPGICVWKIDNIPTLTYVGEWSGTEMHGHGWLFNEAESYVGDFLRGNQHGKGKRTLKPEHPEEHELVEEGTWHNG